MVAILIAKIKAKEKEVACNIGGENRIP